MPPSKKKSQVVEEPPEMFVVEAFVGRYKKFVGGQGLTEEYLVKWHGYDYNEATWEPLESMGLVDPGTLLEPFESEAKAQGINLKDAKELILFKEAVDAGWRGYRDFSKRG
ncbi:hypothetical protein CPB84DRAFT_1790817 [Gymnopilus junonius]|uniref:Chromo domain-containing protein n=1 Tax=Gymnopilus junonius TaxID=109634 RepID=A0A9P5NF38_GYMJU|nr:hypothetical protein CPB84DRAFT_1796548 [Gymnopilus junonius]KAF8882497.1 hypothetical protein CPB84DRAFT_1790817 [Gymnopilus junonius]